MSLEMSMFSDSVMQCESAPLRTVARDIYLSSFDLDPICLQVQSRFSLQTGTRATVSTFAEPFQGSWHLSRSIDPSSLSMFLPASLLGTLGR